MSASGRRRLLHVIANSAAFVSPLSAGLSGGAAVACGGVSLVGLLAFRGVSQASASLTAQTTDSDSGERDVGGEVSRCARLSSSLHSEGCASLPCARRDGGLLEYVPRLLRRLQPHLLPPRAVGLGLVGDAGPSDGDGARPPAPASPGRLLDVEGAVVADAMLGLAVQAWNARSLFGGKSATGHDLELHAGAGWPVLHVLGWRRKFCV